MEDRFASGVEGRSRPLEVSALPPTMSVSWPACGERTLPETGASRIPAPRRPHVGLERPRIVSGSDRAHVDGDRSGTRGRLEQAVAARG